MQQSQLETDMNIKNHVLQEVCEPPHHWLDKN